MAKRLDFYKKVPKITNGTGRKKKRPRFMAVVDEDNCTGCLVCIPFCPVDCIEPVNNNKYKIIVPPVQVRFDECIGCQACYKACKILTWDAFKMMPTDEFEQVYNITIS